MKRVGILTFVFSVGLMFSILFLSKFHSYQFERDCSGYLKRAADANSLSLAAGELDKALEFVETNGLTEGNTQIFFYTPSCDLSFWYQNLKSARDELKAFPSDADRLTISNQLIKLRETIVDQREKGPRVTLPSNIALFPNQTIYRTALLGSFAGITASMFFIETEESKTSCSTVSSTLG